MMAADVSEVENIRDEDDILHGNEPGASRNAVFLASDSFEELTTTINSESVTDNGCQTELNRGNISRIASITSETDSEPELENQIENLSVKEELYNSSGDVSTNETDIPAKTRTENNLQDKELISNRPNERLNCDINKEDTSKLGLDVDSPNTSGKFSNHTFVTVNRPDSENSTIAENANSSDYVKDPVDSGDICTAESTIQDGESASFSPKHDSSPDEEDLEYIHSVQWKQHRKHIFILSEAGKPIYSRYGEEDRMVTLIGLMQALVSVVQDSKDQIRCIVAGQHKCVFLIRDHLILVAVACTCESMQQLMLQLNYVYNQVLSLLTYSQLARIFKQRRNYDLRRLLTGAEKFFDNLLNMMDTDPSFLLGALRCLPLDSAIRDTITQIIAQNAKVKDLVFAILITENQLITLVRMKRYFLHPLDLHLVFNLVNASESFKTAESWTPICLPKFDSGGYLHAHISYLDADCLTCLLLLTVDRDMFFTLAECKYKIQQKLYKQNCLKAISDSVQSHTYKIGRVGIPDLRHFIYKCKSTAQYTSPEFDVPYSSQEDRDRITGLYQYMYRRIHSTARPLQILFHVGQYETLLGWVTSGFELYAVFGPLVTKSTAISSVKRLLKWIKNEEDRLFICDSATF